MFPHKGATEVQDCDVMFREPVISPTDCEVREYTPRRGVAGTWGPVGSSAQHSHLTCDRWSTRFQHLNNDHISNVQPVPGKI
jgi:hypothetical protein